MNLNEVQAVYYLLHALQFDIINKQQFNLVVSYKNKILTAEYLPLTESKTSIILKNFDSDYDIQEKRIDNCLPKEMFSLWKKNKETVYFSTKKAFSYPELLLEEIVNFVSKNSKKSQYIEPLTRTVRNVHFLETNLKLKSMLINDDNFEILEIKVDDDSCFIEF